MGTHILIANIVSEGSSLSLAFLIIWDLIIHSHFDEERRKT